MRTKKRSRAEVLSPKDQETYTIISTGNTIGDTVAPWLIFKQFPTLEWSYIEGDPNMRFAQSDSAFSNGDITLEWAKHFNCLSWEKFATVQERQLDFEEWFGCNEHLKKSYNPDVIYDVPPEHHEKKDLVWRLLIIDGFSGHGSYEFREYCIKFNIPVAFLLPHSIHILQPMDVGVFQYLKNAHQKKLREALQKESLTFNHRDFAVAFQEIFDEGFTAYHARLREIRAIPSHKEACSPISSLQEAAGEEMRIEKRYDKRKGGKRAKPVGDYIRNISLQELRDQQEQFIIKGREKERKPQIRSTRSIIIWEMERLKEDWRANKEVIVDDRQKKLQFKQWLEHTGKRYDYLSMETALSQMTEALKEETDGFIIDTQLRDEVTESIRKARFAPKPLNAVDFSQLLGSDDSVTFQLTQRPADEEIEEEEEEEILPLYEPADHACLPPSRHYPPPRALFNISHNFKTPYEKSSGKKERPQKLASVAKETQIQHNLAWELFRNPQQLGRNNGALEH
ncbi:uncharacterized protein FFNC_00034 [Fusarium fujikuroi]|nr:uncharacterized protein FFE2_00037 [Fusarium fujikuroi]SCO27937.1 uncharacterized protein FFNC_00034 [Fusarium fujikuroi]SCV25969.1 uncharacterized protein FFFS_00034 [Fusarium fujikuroi]